MNPSKPAPIPASSGPRRTTGLLLVIAASLAVGVVGTLWYLGQLPFQKTETAAPETPANESGDAATDQGDSKSTAPGTIELPQDRWATSGVSVGPVVRDAFDHPVTVTGKVALNQDRIAHIYSMVEGSVDNVSVTLGQQVQANAPLAVIHSREVGSAKLQLYQARLQAERANNQARLQQEIAANTRELLDFLREGRPIEEIETAFADRPMGDYRELALAAYSNFLKSEADYLRLTSVADSGAVAGKQVLIATANRNADQATFKSRLEQIAYDLNVSTLSAAQAVKEADAMVLVAATNLRILGVSDNEIESIDPVSQGESLSDYVIRAPFDGTILSKDVVLREQVRPDVMLLSIADLSTVWVTVDIFEENIPLLASLPDKTIRFRSNAVPDQVFEATVFHTGEVMDDQTRTISLRAITDNPGQKLKPGTFVVVELPGRQSESSLLIPHDALQEHEGQNFVFVHQGEGRFTRRDVKIGRADEHSVVIIDGLDEGDSIAVQGGFVLKSLLLADLLGEE